jgi:hydroxymethylbilane synthase
VTPDRPPRGPGPARLRAATRGRPLALWQTREVARRLAPAGIEVTEVVVETTGDRVTNVPIHQIGGQGVFAKEVQTAVLEGRADFAVHSAKDLPPRTAPGLVLAAVPVRGDVRDALAGRALDDLGPGALIATGSVRRRAQLAWLRPDLSFTDLRGNIATRLAKLDRVDAVVVAYAALVRLDRAGEAAEVLEPARLLPQVGQGALAVECREDDAETRRLLAGIEDAAARTEVDAERAYLDRLGGACDLPVGALARAGSDRTLTLEGLVASGEGRVVIRRRVEGPSAAAVELGSALAEEILAHGGAHLLGQE